MAFLFIKLFREKYEAEYAEEVRKRLGVNEKFMKLVIRYLLKDILGIQNFRGRKKAASHNWLAELKLFSGSYGIN